MSAEKHKSFILLFIFYKKSGISDLFRLHILNFLQPHNTQIPEWSDSATVCSTSTCVWKVLHALFCVHSPCLLTGTLNSNISEWFARHFTVAAWPHPVCCSLSKHRQPHLSRNTSWVKQRFKSANQLGAHKHPECDEGKIKTIQSNFFCKDKVSFSS